MSEKNSEPSPGVRHVVVEAELAGQRIDNFLMRTLGGVPKTLIYRILRRGEVRVNSGRVKQTYRIQPGDVVRIPPVRVDKEAAPPKPSRNLTQSLEQAVILEDDRWLVLNKPSGVAVHGGSGERLGVIEAMRVLRPNHRYLELVHRLDKDTSGCLLLAVRRSALRAAHEALREREARKEYLMLVKGAWPRGLVQIDAPLAKNALRSGERVVRIDETNGKASRTRFRVVDSSSECSLVIAQPTTGRTHQIRVHAASAGHPIVGDGKYGDKAFDAHMASLGGKRLFLHATRLQIDAVGLDVAAPPGEEWRALTGRLGLTMDLAPPEKSRRRRN
jgi:23S rRNA pseudouridine955/2504/2580 synthase